MALLGTKEPSANRSFLHRVGEDFVAVLTDKTTYSYRFRERELCEINVCV